MKFNFNILIIGAGTLILAAGAYWYFFTGTGNDSPLTASQQPNEAQSRFETLISELQPITFDLSIFNDPRFQSLSNISTPITPEPAGRSDPFSTLGR